MSDKVTINRLAIGVPGQDSDHLRLFSIDDAAIHVGERLRDHEGLLGGRPTRSLDPCPAP